MLIAFPLLSLLIMAAVYRGIYLQHNPPRRYPPWAMQDRWTRDADPRPLMEDQRFDPAVGYDEKLQAELREMNNYMTKGGAGRGLLFLLIVGGVVWLVFANREVPWYLRLAFCVPCGGAAAMSLYNFMHRK